MLRRPVETAQHLAIRYTERLAEAGIEPSVGSVGDPFDNALAETVIGLFKTEVIRRRGPWRSLEAVEFATLDWVDWFNHRRLFGPIGHVPPAKAEARFHDQLENTAMAAQPPNENRLLSSRAGLSSLCGRHPVCLRGERARFPAWEPSASSLVILNS